MKPSFKIYIEVYAQVHRFLAEETQVFIWPCIAAIAVGIVIIVPNDILLGVYTPAIGRITIKVTSDVIRDLVRDWLISQLK